MLIDSVFRIIFLSALISISTAFAKDEPGWNVRNAAEKLIDKHALRLPVGDWFLRRRDGEIVQYYKPSITFTRAGAGWEAQVLTARWRKRTAGTWGAWVDAQPKYSIWRMATIGLDAPATGGAKASFTNANETLEGFTPPNESTVSQLR